MTNGYPDGIEPELWLRNDMGDILRIEVSVQDALPTWMKLRDAVEKTGRWPVLLGDPNSVKTITNPEYFEVHVIEDLEAARHLDGQQVLRDSLREQEEEIEDEEYTPEDISFDPNQLEGVAMDEPVLLSFDRVETVIIALLPSPNGWETPAHFGYGSWNAYPNVPEHVAMLKHWSERYGADLAVFTSDTVELLLTEPIRDPMVAKEVAIEWYAYSFDNVEQGAGSVLELADAMLGSRVWFSWWD